MWERLKASFRHSVTILWARVVALLGVLLTSAQSLIADPSVNEAVQLAAQARAHSLLRDRDRARHRARAPPHGGRERARAAGGTLMFAMVLAWLGNLLGGPFAKAAVDAYRAKLSAENTSEKIAADLAARELAVESRERELATQIVIAEQGRWYTALPRPLFAFAFIIYVWKVVVWDKVLGLGATDPLSGDVAQWAMIVLTAYFGGRSLEKVARILGRK